VAVPVKVNKGSYPVRLAAGKFCELPLTIIVSEQGTFKTEFSTEQKNVLGKRLEKILDKKVRLNFKTDLSLVGGFIAKVNDTLYDASIRHQLELLKKQFLTGEISLN
jgi:sulfopyruvate decarboxylase TPP-binding subunit